MTRRLLRLLLLLSTVPLSAKPECAVTAVYSRKPRITLCGVLLEPDADSNKWGEVRVYREKKLVARQALDLPPLGITFGRTPDGKRRIEVDLDTHKPNGAAALFRWNGRELTSIGEVSTYWGIQDIDIDGDGKAELLDTGCCGSRDGCATHIMIGFQRWTGKEYESEEREYLDLFGAEAGKPPGTLTLSATEEERETKHYRLIVVNGGGGLRAGEVRLNGKLILGAKRLQAGFRRVAVPLDLRGGPDCPEMTAVARGRAGARLTVLIEVVK